MRNYLKGLWTDENGATAVEYALMAAGIAAAIAAAVGLLGGEINTTLGKVQNAVKAP